jgi:hypothetical protein
LLVLAAIGEVGAHEHQPGQLALRARGRLQRDRGQPRDLLQDLLQPPLELEHPLRALVVLVRVEVAEAGQPPGAFVDARVVLHRAGAERVEAGVDAEVAVGERGDVADELRLGDLRQPRRMGAAELGRQLRLRQSVVGHAPCTPAWAASLIDELHPWPGAFVDHPETSASTSASRSMSAGIRFSVTVTRRTSSSPS